jgi:hypothetical protein
MMQESTTKMMTLAVSAVGILIALGNAWSAWYMSKKIRHLNALSAVEGWRRDVRAWAGASIELLSRSIYCCWDDDVDQSHLRREYVHQLSAQVELGRMFFPNIPAQHVGADKPTAYQGYRHTILDPLVAVIQVLEHPQKTGVYQSPKEAVEAMRRRFVSQVQKILRPSDQNHTIAELIRSTAKKAPDETFGGLLPNIDSVPLGAFVLFSRS